MCLHSFHTNILAPRLLIKTCFTRNTCLGSSIKRHLLHTLNTLYHVTVLSIQFIYVWTSFLSLFSASKYIALNFSRTYCYAALGENSDTKDNIFWHIWHVSAHCQVFTYGYSVLLNLCALMERTTLTNIYVFNYVLPFWFVQRREHWSKTVCEYFIAVFLFFKVQVSEAEIYFILAY